MRVAMLLAAIAALWVQPAQAVSFVVSGTVTPDANGRGLLSFVYPNGNWPFRAEILLSAIPEIEIAYAEQKGFIYICDPDCVPAFNTVAYIDYSPVYSGNLLTFQSHDATPIWSGNQYATFQEHKEARVFFKDVAAPFTYSGTITMLPEPTTWALMILGVGLTGLALRRRQLKVQLPPLPAFAPLLSPAP